VNEELVIIFAKENGLVIITPIDDVIRNVSNGLPRLSRHKNYLSKLAQIFKKNVNPSPILFVALRLM